MLLSLMYSLDLAAGQVNERDCAGQGDIEGPNGLRRVGSRTL
jgi:hypothetical protein